MKVKMILPSLAEADAPLFRPVKYSLFPPLGLAALAAFFNPDDNIEIVDQHVEKLKLNDSPDLVVIQVYITSAYKAYRIADYYRNRGAYVVLGSLHVTSMPDEAQKHADTIFLGPGEDTFPEFLKDFRRGFPKKRYQSTSRSLIDVPSPRRDLIKRSLYLVPNSIVVTRGCPNHCEFCFKESFFKGGRQYYKMAVHKAITEINELPGSHLYFLDNNLFADERFVDSLLDGLMGMGRVWQCAATIDTVLKKPLLMKKARDAGLRSVFIGFETLGQSNLRRQNKHQNVGINYNDAIKVLRDLGVMVNGSFVYGMDDDGPDVFKRTVDWAVSQGIETATFHILTPYPGTPVYERMKRQRRLLHSNWDLYDTRHAVYRPARLTVKELEQGYQDSYRDFYRWSAIYRGARTKPTLKRQLRHMAYSAGWKKMEPLWKMILMSGQIRRMSPLLEQVLNTKKLNEVKKSSVLEESGVLANSRKCKATEPGIYG